MKKLNGKIALVTGGGKGIGKAIAKSLAHEGMNIAIIGRDKMALETAEKEIKKDAGVQVFAYSSDISKPENVKLFKKKVNKELGEVQVLVNNAAGWLEGTFLDAKENEIEEVIDTTIKAAIWMCREFWKDLKKAKPGYIVNITTGGVRPNRSNAIPVYVAAKCGLSGFTESLRRYAIKEDIRVTEILPGSVASEIDMDAPEAEVLKKYGRNRIPSKDIAEAVIFALKRSQNGMVEDISIPAIGDW